MEGEGSGPGYGQWAPEFWLEVRGGEAWSRAGVWWLRLEEMCGYFESLEWWVCWIKLGRRPGVGCGRRVERVHGHPGPSWVLGPQKAEDEEAQALDPIILPPGIRDKKRIVDRKFIHRLTLFCSPSVGRDSREGRAAASS